MVVPFYVPNVDLVVRPPPTEPSAVIAARVAAARANPRPTGVDPKADDLLSEAERRMKLDARWKAAILSVAGTLAMMDAAPCVARIHPAEALSYVWRETDGRWLEALCR